jgi:hypothetical protein
VSAGADSSPRPRWSGPSGLNPRSPDPDREWEGEYRRYDLVKEFVAALLAVTLLTVVLAVIFESPDVKPATIGTWSRADPHDFLATAITELDGSSGIAGYGPPYNNMPGAGQKIGPVSLQRIPGVRIPIDTAQDFVIAPLSIEAPNDPTLAEALSTYQSASPQQQKAWTDAYTKGLDKVTFAGGIPELPSGDYGPVQTMMARLLGQAESGGLDGALLSSKQFYQTDYTKPLLFMSDGGYLAGLAEKEHLLGTQWGMMNESGNYPGQAWLWLYTFWYQIRPFKNSGNADVLIWAIMAVLTLGLILIPFIPGLRSLPKRLGVYRLIWRDYYRRVEGRET